MKLEATAGCGQTPRILFLAEELGLSLEIQVRPDGFFNQRYLRVGPVLRDGDLSLFEGNAIMRHLCRAHGQGRLLPADPPALARVDSWLDFGVTRVGATGARLMTLLSAKPEQREAARIEEEQRGFAQALAILDEAVTGREWIADELSVADCAMITIPRFAPRLGLTPPPALAKYCERLTSRPAWKAVEQRLASLAVPSTPALPDAEEVLEFWFGATSSQPAPAMRKIRRWFQGGPELDRDVRARFQAAVEAAIEGRLDHWASSPRGRRALIILLDQLTRNIYRDDARTYAGDARAQAMTLAALDAHELAGLSFEEHMFLTMPLLHAESLELQAKSVADCEQRAAAFGPEHAPMAAMALEQARKYYDIIERFGRFPHRNTLLGRTSSPEELEFLKDWAEKQPPSAARRGSL